MHATVDGEEPISQAAAGQRAGPPPDEARRGLLHLDTALTLVEKRSTLTVLSNRLLRSALRGTGLGGRTDNNGAVWAGQLNLRRRPDRGPRGRRSPRCSGGAPWHRRERIGDVVVLPAPRGDPVEPQLVYYGDVNQQAAWEALFSAFNESNPGIKITPTASPPRAGASSARPSPPSSPGRRVRHRLRRHRGPAAARLKTSCCRSTTTSPDQEAIDDYFADVNPNLREWTVTYGSPDGQTYYIPGGYNTMVMYCNTEVFEEAGVELGDGLDVGRVLRSGVAIKESTGRSSIRSGPASSSATSCRGC